MERISLNETPQGMRELLLNVELYLAKSGMDKKLLNLVKMRASQINSCAYCLDMHSKEALHAGETEQRLISLSAWRETSYYSQKERAVLAFTETLTRLPEEQSSDHIHDELSTYFSKEEIAYLTLCIAQINTWNRLVRSFGPVPGSYMVKQRVSGNGVAS